MKTFHDLGISAYSTIFPIKNDEISNEGFQCSLLRGYGQNLRVHIHIAYSAMLGNRVVTNPIYSPHENICHRFSVLQYATSVLEMLRIITADFIYGNDRKSVCNTCSFYCRFLVEVWLYNLYCVCTFLYLRRITE